jgi:cytochrome c oxidase subunit II
LQAISQFLQEFMNHFKGTSMQKLVVLFSFLVFAYTVQAANPDPKKGKQIFETTCTACHKIGGRLIGPDLAGVKGRWGGDIKKITAFVHNPGPMLASDPRLKKLQADMGGVVMAAQPQLSDQDVADVIEYVNDPTAAVGGGGKGPVSTENYIPVPADNSLLKWLFIGALILVIIIVYLANRIWNSFGHKDDDHDGFDGPSKGWNWQKINSWLFPIFGVIFMGGLIYECTIHLTPHYTLPVAASDIGQEIDRLFMNTVYVTAIVFFVTQILLFYYGFKYRKREGRKAYYYPHNNTVEFIWTTIPAIVLSYLVLDGFRVWRQATDNPDNNPFVVEAFAKQFDWSFRYPGPDGKLGKTDFRKISGDNPLGIDFSDPASKDDYIAKELHMIAGRDTKIKLRSQDVIHDAYLPHFRMQLYAQPGMDNMMRFKPLYTTEEMRAKTANDKFDYEMACNQLCGSQHYHMRAVVVVGDQKDFNKWQSTNKSAFSTYKPSKQTASIK